MLLGHLVGVVFSVAPVPVSVHLHANDSVASDFASLTGPQFFDNARAVLFIMSPGANICFVCLGPTDAFLMVA